MNKTIDSGKIYALLQNCNDIVKVNTAIYNHNDFLDENFVKITGREEFCYNGSFAFMLYNFEQENEYPHDLVIMGIEGKITIEDCICLKNFIEKTIAKYYNNGYSYFYEGVEMIDETIVINGELKNFSMRN